jgi:hypothetical protein
MICSDLNVFNKQFYVSALRLHKRPSHLSNRPIVGGVDADISSFPYQVSYAV